MSENSYWRRRKKRTWYNDPFAFVLGGDMKDVETWKKYKNLLYNNQMTDIIGIFGSILYFNP